MFLRIPGLFCLKTAYFTKSESIVLPIVNLNDSTGEPSWTDRHIVQELIKESTGENMICFRSLSTKMDINHILTTEQAQTSISWCQIVVVSEILFVRLFWSNNLSVLIIFITLLYSRIYSYLGNKINVQSFCTIMDPGIIYRWLNFCKPVTYESAYMQKILSVQVIVFFHSLK